MLPQQRRVPRKVWAHFSSFFMFSYIFHFSLYLRWTTFRRSASAGPPKKMFFSHIFRPDFDLFSSLWGSSRGIVASVRAMAHPKCAFGLLGHVVRARSLAGFGKQLKKCTPAARLVSLVECVGLVGCRVTVFCGLGVASYPQPPDRSQHGCTVGIDWDPPPPPRQGGGGTRAPVLTYVRCCCTRGRAWSWWFYRVELSVIRTLPRTISRALSFDLGTALTRPTALTLSSRQTHPTSACARDLGPL